MTFLQSVVSMLTRQSTADAARQTVLLQLLNQILQGQTLMSEALSNLQTEVASAITIEKSAVALISGIADRITAAGTDATALSDLTATLKAESDQLAAAVAANTPAADTSAPVAPVPATDPNAEPAQVPPAS